MTMDDESSVYVGGLSFDTTEDILRDRFEEFGTVVAVKIIVDKDSGNSRGYGFITFTNPRSATKAINNMNGVSLDGRTIRVNEVTAKSGNRFGRDNARFAPARDRGRGRENRDFRLRDRGGNARQFSPPRNRRASPGAYRADRGRMPLYRHSSRSPEGRSLSRTPSPVGKQDRSSASLSPESSDRIQNADGVNKRNAKLFRRAEKEREDDLMKMKDDLVKANEKRDDLRKRLTSLEEENASKELQVVELRNKSQKLEESLSSAVLAAAQKHTQLLKLQRAFLRVRNCAEQLRSSENELQALIDDAAREGSMTGFDLHERRSGNLKSGPESDMGLRDDDDAGPVNIED
ncbi:hypothetical protein KP509_18G038200 [Ceratopteris richardii]|uniref:RRM domain-containing protein n=1 Tax=Ceratopteris richardii TaxID=49495 RepID=A0A8T2SQW1_CERRI|nr:hypothetical protein KP509_18G038200 [Ceratopteris richardii]